MPPRTRVVESVTERRHGAADCWEVITRAVDGSGLTHVFPKETLEWRSAEYGVAAADVDTLLDVVLHEPFLEEEDAPTLFTALSTAQARDAHLARISKAKAARAAIVLDGKNNPLDVIRDHPGISTEGVRAKREQVDVHRWNRLYGGLPVPPADTVEVPRA